MGGSWWDSIGAATLLGAVIGAVAAISAGFLAAWWTERSTARRADTDRLFQGKLDAYAALMALTSTFRAGAYHWDLWDRAHGDDLAAPSPATTSPRLEEDEFLAVAGSVRLLASADVAERLDEIEALLFSAHDLGRWTNDDTYACARHLTGMEEAMRHDLGAR